MKKINKFILVLLCCIVANIVMAQPDRDPHCLVGDVATDDTEVVTLASVSKIKKYKPLSTTTPPPPPPPTTFDRLIFLVHGLGGNTDTWSKASYAIQGGAPGFPTRKATALRPTYSEFILSGAGIDLHNALVEYDPHMQEGMEPEYNFVIASSQGGLVARAADQYERTVEQERRFNGIVTFGTPHQGARILNNIPLLLDLVGDGLSALPAGPIAEEIETSIVLDAFTSGVSANNLVSHAANFIADNIVPVMMSDYLSPITEDYKVGAPAVTALNDAPSDVHKIAFFGAEDEPVLWRTQASLTVQNPNEADYFAADQDHLIMNVANTNLSNYQSKYLDWKETVDDWNFWDAINIFDGLTKNEAEYIRDEYKRGYDWWNQANNRYKVAIGALIYESNTVQNCMCIEPWNIFSGGDPVTITSGPCASSAPNCFTTSNTTYTAVHKDSDGVVLAESAGDFPGASTVYLLPGSNHQQMRNDPNTKDVLLKLFNGEFDPYFQTDQM